MTTLLHRHRFGLALILAIAMVAVAWPGLAAAQSPGPGIGGPRVDTGVRGDAPSPGGIGLMVASRDQDRDQIMLHLQDQDCEPLTLAVLTDGRWHVYIPGAPARLASDFPVQLAADTPFFVRCRADAPSIVRVGVDDNAGAVSLQVGQRLRVTLESNPTTGYSWQPASTIDATVLEQVGGPIFVPSSSLIGAGGTETFDFIAVGAGTTEVAFEYLRPFEANSMVDSWSVTATVAAP